MGGTQRIAYTPRPDATPEAELDVLASVYRFLLIEKSKEGGSPTAPDDAKGSKHARAKTIIPESP